MTRWHVIAFGFLCMGRAVASPPLSTDDKLLRVLQSTATQVELASLLVNLSKDHRFLMVRNECLGGRQATPVERNKELEEVEAELKDESREINTAVNGCRGQDSVADALACSSLGKHLSALEKSTLRINALRVAFLSPPEGALSAMTTAQSNPERVAACAHMAEVLDALEYATPDHALQGKVFPPQLARQSAQDNLRLRTSFLYHAAGTDTLATASVAMGAVTSQPLGFAERLGGTDHLSLALGSSFGSSHAISGTRLLMTLGTPLGDEEDSSGTLGLRFEFPLSRTATAGPFPDATQRLAYQYDIVGLLNFHDKTDPRRKERSLCYRSADALSPALGVDPSALQGLEQQRHGLYALCGRQALPAWRVGLRPGVTFRSNPRERVDLEMKDAPGSRVQLGQASLGAILELAPWMVLQAVGRRDFTVPSVQGSAAIHLGGGVAGRLYGIESIVHLGVDVSTAWRHRMHSTDSDDFSSMAAPSLALKVTKDALLAVSGGYVFGGPRSGFVASAALVWDMDRFFLTEPSPLSSAK